MTDYLLFWRENKTRVVLFELARLSGVSAAELEVGAVAAVPDPAGVEDVGSELVAGRSGRSSSVRRNLRFSSSGMVRSSEWQ